MLISVEAVIGGLDIGNLRSIPLSGVGVCLSVCQSMCQPTKYFLSVLGLGGEGYLDLVVIKSDPLCEKQPYSRGK